MSQYMRIKLQGDLFCQEIFGSREKCYAQLRHHQYPGMNFNETERKESKYEYPINFFNLNVELVPPRGCFSRAEYNIQLVITDEKPTEEIDVGSETTSANTCVSVGTFYDENDMLRLRGIADTNWVGDCVLPWGPPEVLDPDSEYYALLKVSYDHETSLDNIDTEEWSIEARREQTWKNIQEIYEIQGQDIENVPGDSTDSS